MARFPVLGRSCVVGGPVGLVARHLREQWFFPEHRPVETGGRIIVRTADACPFFAEALPYTEAAIPDEKMVALLHGDIVLFRHGGCGLCLDARQGDDTRVTVWGECEYTGQWLNVAMIEALRLSGLMPLHASVACDRGRATAFVGASGAGKSTTAVWAMAAGRDIICEDLAWLDPARLLVYGWDRKIRLLHETIAKLWPDWYDCHARGCPDRKLTLSYGQLPTRPGDGTHRLGAAPLVQIAILSRDPGAPSSSQPATRREAVLAVWGATGMPLTARARQIVSKLVPVVLHGVRFLRVHLGNTPVVDVLNDEVFTPEK